MDRAFVLAPYTYHYMVHSTWSLSFLHTRSTCKHLLYTCRTRIRTTHFCHTNICTTHGKLAHTHTHTHTWACTHLYTSICTTDGDHGQIHANTPSLYAHTSALSIARTCSDTRASYIYFLHLPPTFTSYIYFLHLLPTFTSSFVSHRVNLVRQQHLLYTVAVTRTGTRTVPLPLVAIIHDHYPTTDAYLERLCWRLCWRLCPWRQTLRMRGEMKRTETMGRRKRDAGMKTREIRRF